MGLPAPGRNGLWPVWVGYKCPGTFGLLFVRQSDLWLKRKTSGCRPWGSGAGLQALKWSGLGIRRGTGATDSIGYSSQRILSPVGRQACKKIEGRVMGEPQKCRGDVLVEHRGQQAICFDWSNIGDAKK